MVDSYTRGHLHPQPASRPAGAPLREVSYSGATTADLTASQQVAGGSNPPQLAALDPGWRR